MQKEIIKIPQIKEKAEQAILELMPRLFNLVGVAKSNSKIMLYSEIHYTPKEAIEGFMERVPGATGIMKENWSVKITASISAEDLEKNFIQHMEKIKSEKKIHKNKLMKEILDNKDIGLLHRNYTRFSMAEALYLHEQLTKK